MNMSHANVYAVIDLGSSSIRGMIAHKLKDGMVSPIACESLPTEGCIKHGAVYNIDGTTEKIAEIIARLNQKLEDNYTINKLYIGLGAQSLRSEEEVIRLELDENGEEIRDTHIAKVFDEIEQLSFPRRVIIDYLPPYYEVDGRTEAFPRSIVCREFVAHVSLITVKDWVYNNVRTVVEDRLKMELAGILPTPLCEANIMLSPSQRQLGAVFVNIGGGTSSVVIFQDGVFRRLRLLPFGGKNVTKDLESLHLTEEQAEEIKLQYAGATTYADRDKTFEIPSFDGVEMRMMRVIDVNRYTSARMREITENIFEVVKASQFEHLINAGFVFTGGGTKIKRFDELLKNYTRNYTFNTQLSSVIDHNNPLSSIPEMATAIALAYVADEDCVKPIAQDLQSLFNNTSSNKTQTYTSGQHDNDSNDQLSQTQEVLLNTDDEDAEGIWSKRFNEFDDNDSHIEPEYSAKNKNHADESTPRKRTRNPALTKIKSIFSQMVETFKETSDDNDEL